MMAARHPRQVRGSNRQGSRLAKLLVFERQSDHGRDRYTLEFGADSLRLQTEELPAQGAPLLRNSYQFTRRAP